VETSVSGVGSRIANRDTLTPVPELPEVEVALARIAPHLVNHRIARVTRLHAATRRALSSARATKLVGREIVAAQRRGKYQCLRLDDDSTLVAHFRLNGDWAVRLPDAPLPRHARCVLSFDAGHDVVLTDSRALATITWHAAGTNPVPTLGPEPFDPALDASALAKRLASRRAAIKLVLLDQRVIAGIGNIYAAEALWHAQVHPDTSAQRLSLPRVRRLLAAIRFALQRGLDAPGRVYGTDGTPETSHPLMAYGRDGEPCARCGRRIIRDVHAGRGTWWCPRCQRA
jgi:formamidopyrimidine-DNA glycosylase